MANKNNNFEENINSLINSINVLNENMKLSAKDKVDKRTNNAVKNNSNQAVQPAETEIDKIRLKGMNLVSYLQDFQNQGENFAGSMSDILTDNLQKAIQGIDVNIKDSSVISNFKESISSIEKELNTTINSFTQDVARAKVNLSKTYRQTAKKAGEIDNIYMGSRSLKGIKRVERSDLFTQNEAGKALLNSAMNSGNKTISSTRASLEKQLKEAYSKGYIGNQEYYNGLLKEIRDLKIDKTDLEFRNSDIDSENPFRRITDEMSNYVSSTVKQTNGSFTEAIKKIIGIGDNIVPGDQIKIFDGFSDEIYNIYKDLKGYGLFNNNAIEKRLQKINGKKAQSLYNHDFGEKLEKALTSLSNEGLGFTYRNNIESGTVDFGLFDPDNIDDIFSLNSKGKKIANWDKMTKFSLGVSKNGGFSFNGMELSDVFKPIIEENSGGGYRAKITTASNQMTDDVLSYIAKNARYIADSVMSGNTASAESQIKSIAEKSVQGIASRDIYKNYGISQIKDVSKDYLGGASPLQKINRSNRVSLDDTLISAWKKHFGGKDPTSSELQKMIDYVYADSTTNGGTEILKKSGLYNEIFNVPDGFSGKSAESFLKPLSSVIKSTFPTLGISSIKEGNYWQGNLAGIDTQALNPWLVANSATYRGVSQGSNHMKSATNRNSGSFRNTIVRSNLLEEIGKEYGFDYNSPEYKNAMFAELSNEEISKNLRSYYDTLEGEELQNLYKRYIGKKVPNTDAEIREVLKNRIMPSVNDGGIVMSENMAKELSAYMQINKTISEEDLESLGLQVPTKSGIKYLDNVSSKRSNNIKLSNGDTITPDDILRAVQLEDNGKISLRYDKFSGEGDHIKLVTGTTGERYTSGGYNILSNGEYDYLTREFSGLHKPDLITERTDYDRRKIAGQTAAQYEALFENMTQNQMQDLFSGKLLNEEDTSLLNRFLNYDKDSNTILGRINSFQEFNKQFTEEEGKALFSTSWGSIFDKITKSVFGEDSEAYNAFMKNNVHAQNINKAIEYEYFDPTGTRDIYDTDDSRVRITSRERETYKRNASLLDQIYNEDKLGEVYQKVYDKYTKVNPENVRTAKAIRGNLIQSYNDTVLGENLNKNIIKASDERAKTWGNEVKIREGGKIALSDFENTILGEASKGSFVLDLEDDFQIANSDGSSISLNKLKIPQIPISVDENGLVTNMGDLFSPLNSLIKNVQEYNHVKTSMDENGATEEGLLRLDQLRGTISEKSLPNILSAYYNGAYAKEGLTKKLEETTRISNASAMKAQAANLPDYLDTNTIVVSSDRFKDLYRYSGKDINTLKNNVKNLKSLRSKMAEETGEKWDSKKTNIDEINDYEQLRNIQESLLNGLVKKTDVYNKFGTGTVGDIKRYPFSADQGLTGVNIRTVSGDLAKEYQGKFATTNAVAEKLNLDWDGDTSYLQVPIMSVDNKDFDSSYEALKQYSNYEKDVTDVLTKMDQAESKIEGVSDLSKKEKALETMFGTRGEFENLVSGMLSKKDFAQVGKLSNLAQGARLGMRYSGSNLDDFVNSKIVSAFFEPLEQDSISAKKIISRLDFEADLNGKSATDVKSTIGDMIKNKGIMDFVPKTIEDLQKLQKIDFTDTNSAKSTINNIVDNAYNRGIMSDGGQRQSQILQAQIESMIRKKVENADLYEESLKQYGLFDSRISDFEGNLIEDNRGMWGAIDRNSYKNALYTMGMTEKGGNAYAKGMKTLYKNNGSYDKDSQAIRDQAVRDFNYKYRKSGKYASESSLSQGDTYLGTNEGFTSEIGTESIQAASVVINAGNAVVNSGTTNFGHGQSGQPRVSREQISNTESVSKKVSQEQVLEDESRARFVGLDTSRDENGKRKHDYFEGEKRDKIKGIGASTLASNLVGKNYGSWVDLPEASEYSLSGDYAHKQLEYLNKTKSQILGLGLNEEQRNAIFGSNTMSELNSVFNSLGIENDKIENLFSDYDMQKVLLRADASNLGLNIDEIFDAGDKMASAMSQAEELFMSVNDSRENPEQRIKKVASELSMAKKYNGQEVGATSDAVYYDPMTNTFTIGDYKSGIYHPGQANIQTSIGIDMLKDTYSKFGEYASSLETESIEDRANQASRYFSESFGDILGENANTLIEAFKQAYINSEGNLGNTSFENVVITSQGKTNGSASVKYMNPVNSNRLTELIDRGQRIQAGEQGVTPLNPEELNIFNAATNMGKSSINIGNLKYNWDEILKTQQTIWKNEEAAEKAINKSIAPGVTPEQYNLYQQAANKYFQANDYLRMNGNQFYQYDKNADTNGGKDAWRGASVYKMQGDQMVQINLTEEEQKNLYDQMGQYQSRHDAKIADIQAYKPKEDMDFLESVFNNFKSSVAYLTKTSLIYGAIGKVKQTFSEIIQTIESLDKAIVNLQIVTRNSREDLSDALTGYTEIASEMGVTTQTVLSASEDWLRAGYSIEEANSLIRDSLKLSVLGMMDAGDATTALISTLKGWKLSTSELDGFVDSVTALDSAFATTASDIATAMSKTNVSANMAGIDIDDLQAYVTTVLDTSQISAETVGTSFKTLISRYGNVKAGKFVSSYDAEASEDDLTALNDVETVLNKVGITTRNSASEFREMDEVLEEIAGKWSTFDSVTKNAVGTAMGGTRQRESLNVLFENWDQVEKAKNVIANSGGTADEKYAAYANSIEAAKNEFTNAIQTYITKSEFLGKIMTNLYNMGADLVKVLKYIVPVLGGAMLVGKISTSGINGLGITQSLNNFGQNLKYGTFAATNGISSGIGGAIGGLKANGLFKTLGSVTGLSDLFVSQKNNPVYQYTAEEMLSAQNIAQMPFIQNGLAKNKQRILKNSFGPKGNTFSDRDYAVASSFLTDDLGASGIRGLYTDNNYQMLPEIFAQKDRFEYLESGYLKEQTFGDDNIQSLYNTAKKIEQDTGVGFKEFSKQDPHLLNSILADKGFKPFVGGLSEGNLSPELINYINNYGGMKGTWGAFGGLKKQSLENYNDILKKNPEIKFGGNAEKEYNRAQAYQSLSDTDKKFVNQVRKQQIKDAGTNIANKAFVASLVTQTVASTLNDGKTVSQAAKGGFEGISDEGAAGLEGLATLGPMLGTMIGGPAGAAVGILGSLVPIVTLIADKLVTTDEEAKQIRSDMNQKLSEMKDVQNKVNEAQDQEEKLKKYAKGVDQRTGENMSLSDSEYQDYQSILDQIAETVNGIEVLTDANGNKILEANGSIIDLNTGFDELSEAIKVQAAEENYDKFYNSDEDYAKNAADAFGKTNKDLMKSTAENSNAYKNAYNDSDVEKNAKINGTLAGITTAALTTAAVTAAVPELSTKAITVISLGIAALSYGVDKAVEHFSRESGAEKKAKQGKPGNNSDMLESLETEQKKDEYIRTYMSGKLKILDEQQKTFVQMAQSADENYYNLDEQTQQFATNIYGHLATGQTAEQLSLNGDKGVWGTEASNEHLQEASQNFIDNIAGPNADASVKYAISYVQNNSKDDNKEDYEDQVDKILEAATEGLESDEEIENVKNSVLTELGYVKDYDRSGDDKYSNLGITAKKVDGTGYITKKEDYAMKTVDKISKVSGMNQDSLKFGVNDLTEDQWKVLYENATYLTSGDISDKTSALKFIMDRNFSTKNTGSQLYSEFKGYVEEASKKKFRNNQAFADFMYSDEGSKYRETAGWQNMVNAAATVGFNIEDGEEQLQAYLDQMDLVGNVNLRFQTDETLNEIADKYQNLDSIFQDISEDGKMSLANLGTLVKEFGDDVIDVLDDPEALKGRIADLQSNKFIEAAASLTKTLGDSEKSLQNYLDSDGKITLRNSDGSVKEVFDAGVTLTDESSRGLKVAGTINRALDLGQAYEKNKNYWDEESGMNYFGRGTGNWYKAGDYGNWASPVKGANGLSYDYIAEGSQFEKDVAAAYGIEGDISDAERNTLLEQILAALEAGGVDTSMIDTSNYNQVMGLYKGTMYGSNGNEMQLMYLEAQKANLENQLTALNAMMATVEDEAWEQEIEKTMSRANSAYSNGSITANQYIASLEAVRNSGHATKEQMEELAEAIEDAKAASADYQYSLSANGKGAAATYRNTLIGLMGQNTLGSQDWIDYSQKYVQTYRDAIDYDKLMMETQVNDDDYKGQRSYYKKIANDYIELARGLMDVGYSTSSPEYLEAMQGYQQAMKDMSQTYVDEFSQLESDYQSGFISGDEYAKAGEELINMASEVGLTTQQFKDLNEKLEDYYETLYTNQLNMGNLSSEEYIHKMISDVLSRNEEGSIDYQDTINKILSAFDQDIQIADYKRQIYETDYDYEAQNQAVDEKIDLLAKKAGYAMAMGYKEDSAEVLSIEADMAVAYKEKDDIVSQRLSDLNKFYSEGYINLKDYTNVLEEIAKDENLTAESAMEINEAMEDVKAQYYERSFSSGNYDNIWDIIIGYTKDVTSNNEMGSDEWYAGIDKIPEFINAEVSKSQKRLQFVDPENYGEFLKANQDSFDLIMTAINTLENTYIENPLTGKLEPLFTENSDTIISLKEAALESLNNQTEAIKNWGEKTHTDYVNGFIDIKQYKTNLDEIYGELKKRVANGEATKEEIAAFREEAQKYFQGKFEDYFTYGDENGKVTQKGFEKAIQGYYDSNVYNITEGELQRINAEQGKQFYDKYYEYLDKRANILDEDDYEARREIIDSKLSTNEYSELANTVHIFGKDSEQTLDVLNRRKEFYKEEEQFISDEMSYINEEFENGYMSMSEAMDRINKVAEDARFEDSKKEALTAKKEWYSDYYLNYAKYDGLSNKEMQEGFLNNVLMNDVYGSKGYYKDLESWMQIGEKQIQNAERDVQLLSDNNYKGKSEAYDDVISSLQEQYKYVALLEGEDSDEAKELMLQIKETYDKKTELISQQISAMSDKYSKGLADNNEYRGLLEEMLEDEELSIEQREAIKEALEDNDAERIAREYQMGTKTWQEASDEFAEKVVNNNKYDSGDYWNEIGNYIQMVEQGISDSLIKADLIDQSTPEGREEVRQIFEESIVGYQDLYKQLRLAGYQEGSPELIQLQKNIKDAYDQIAQVTSNAISKAQDKYANGEITIQDFASEMAGIKEEFDSQEVKTVEQLREIRKGVENIYNELLDYGISTGATTWDQYRQGFIDDVVNSTVKGSQGYYEAIKTLANSYELQNQNLELQSRLTEKTDYKTRRDLLLQERQNLEDEYVLYRAAGYKEDSTEVLQVKEKELQNQEQMFAITDEIVSEMQDNYTLGKMSDLDVSSSINELLKSGELSVEQMDKLTKTMRDLNLNILKNNLKYGTIDQESFREDLIKNYIPTVEVRSDDWYKYMDEFIQSFDDEISALEVYRDLLGGDNTQANLDVVQKELDLKKEEQYTLEAIAKSTAASEEEAEAALMTNQKYLSVLKEELDLEKQKSELKVKQAESVMDSYVTLSDYAINLLNEEKDSVSEYYDMQIEKLEEVNNQKQKSIELIKLEQDLQNAQKEKTRVYQAGVGFVYVKNRQKIKEAEQNLENYYDEQQIDALKNAQQKQNDYYDDLIKNWEDIKKMVDDVERFTDAEKAVQTLINNGIVSDGANISDALNTIVSNATWTKIGTDGVISLEDAINGTDGIRPELKDLGAAFNRYAEQYNTESLALQRFEDLGLEAYTGDINGSVDLNNKTVVKIAELINGNYQTIGEGISALERIDERLSGKDGDISETAEKIKGADKEDDMFKSAEDLAEEDIKNAEADKNNVEGKLTGKDMEEETGAKDSTELMLEAIQAATDAITAKDIGLIDNLKNNTSILSEFPESLSETLQSDLDKATTSFATQTGIITDGIHEVGDNYRLNTTALDNATSTLDKLNEATGLLTAKNEELRAAIVASTPLTMPAEGKDAAKNLIKDGVKRVLGQYTRTSGVYGASGAWTGDSGSIKGAVQYAFAAALEDVNKYKKQTGSVEYSTDITNKQLAKWFSKDATKPHVRINPSSGSGAISVNDSAVASAIQALAKQIAEVMKNLAAVNKKIKELEDEDKKGKSKTFAYYAYSYAPDGHTVTAKYEVYTDGTKKKISGADGTAFAQGTQGNWGSKESGPSLTGEVGPELLVRNGHYKLLGEKSAEINNIRKGDIIFNADQTEQIMKYGAIIRGRRRGKAYANGNVPSDAIDAIRLAEINLEQEMIRLGLQNSNSLSNGYQYSTLQGKQIRSQDNYGETYNFNGNIDLPNVKDPSNFMSELISTANRRFNVINKKYRR